MSKMNNLVLEIQEMISTGTDWEIIAAQLDIPYDWVAEAAETMADTDDCPLDGDHQTSLASIGWGTDEDYGYYEYDR